MMLSEFGLDKLLFMIIIFAVFIVHSCAQIKIHLKDNSTLFRKENVDIRIKRQTETGNIILEMIELKGKTLEKARKLHQIRSVEFDGVRWENSLNCTDMLATKVKTCGPHVQSSNMCCCKHMK